VDGPRGLDLEAVRAKYAAERARRMTVDRTDVVDLSHDERFRSYTEDPFTPYVPRPPITDVVDAV